MFYSLYDSHYFWFVLLPGVILGAWAQFRLSSAFGKYSRVETSNGLSGAQAAREILDRNGLTNVPIAEVAGQLSDHYDPSKRALFLSSDVYHGRTVASVGVAAHETGHALQHQADYAPLQLRTALVPVTQFASYAWMGIIILGMILHGALGGKLLLVGVAVFAITTLFSLVTLPVEFDASRRAKDQLFRLGMVRAEEGEGVRRVLSAAALTYVAALVTSVLQLLYWLSLASGSRRN
jgi:Zn-dependent membrane protease YugP